MTKVQESPFLSDTHIQIAWDSTSLDWLKRCPRLYQLYMIEGWTPNEESVHLRFGIELHTTFQKYDLAKARGTDHEQNLRDCVRGVLVRTADWESDHQLKNKEVLLRTIIWYLDQFERDVAKPHILENGKPAVELSFRFELDYGPVLGDGQPYVICGHLDKIVDYQENLFGMDHKTTSMGLGEYYFRQFEPNNQMTLYTIACQIVIHSPVKGMIIDAIDVKAIATYNEKKIPFGRRFTYRTQAQLDEWLLDLKYHLGKAEEYAVAEYWPMNDTACDKYGGCPFREVCSSDPRVREQLLKSDFHKRDQWNPLQSR